MLVNTSLQFFSRTTVFLLLILFCEMDMDYFDNHYYYLNRKLLFFVGQWPYQNFGDRLKMWILYSIIILSAVASQVAKIMVTEMDFDTWVEIISAQLSQLLGSVRYYAYAINNRKMRTLLDDMRTNWQCLMSSDEIEIFGETAEEGRLYCLYYTMLIFTLLASLAILIFSQPLLEYLHLFNNSHSRPVLYSAEYFLDQKKYYYIIIVHMHLVVLVTIMGVLATDLLLIVFMYHTIGSFKITCHRLEHAFDNYDLKVGHLSGKINATEKIISAVNCHIRTIRFCNGFNNAFQWQNLFTLMLVIVNITVTLYWATMSKGQLWKLIFGVMYSFGQMFHLLILNIPAQMVKDNSLEVTDKAYSSLWYNGRVKEQILLLPVIQRGLRPCHVKLGKMYPISLENYATEVKAAFSYFTMLMSMV